MSSTNWKFCLAFVWSHFVKWELEVPFQLPWEEPVSWINCTVLLKSLASSLWLCRLVLFQAMTLLSYFPWVTWRPQKKHANQPLFLGKFLTEDESGEPGRALEGRNGGICSWLHPIPGLCPWAHPLISPLPSVYPATFFLHTMCKMHDYSNWVCKCITELFLVGGF